MYALPAPTGPHPVGVATLTLPDPHRADPWNGEPREIVVSVRYPARDVTGCPRAPYMTAGAAEVFARFDTTVLHPELPSHGVDWTAIRTHSHLGARPLGGPRPALVYTPGGGDPRTTGTALVEDLASHGYVVIAVDHPGETGEVEFPDGRVRPMGLTNDPRVDVDVMKTAIATRVADVRLVLDVLHAAAGAWPPEADLASAPRPGTGPGSTRGGVEVDLARIGVVGHSAGGATAAQALADDRRLGAATNLEGYLDFLTTEEGEPFPVVRAGVDRPLLLLGTDGFRDERLDRTWRVLARGALVEQLWLSDARHRGLTDFAALAPQLRDAGLMTAGQCSALVGDGDPLPALRHHVHDFFDRHL